METKGLLETGSVTSFKMAFSSVMLMHNAAHEILRVIAAFIPTYKPTVIMSHLAN